MDDVSELLLGSSPATQSQPKQSPAAESFSTGGSYGTPAKLLDNLKAAESSNDATAVHPTTGAMGAYQFLPSTVAGLRKQGVKFDPFDANESRAAADYYISQLVKQNGGDYNKAMAQYGGFKKADPSGYLSKVLNGVDLKQENATTPSSNTASDDVSNLLLGDNGQTPQQKSLRIDVAGTTPYKAEDYGNAVVGAARTMGQGLAGSAVGGWKGMMKLATGGSLDDAVKAVNDTQESLAFHPSNRGEQAGQDIMVSPYNPLNYPSIAGKWLGEKAEDMGASPLVATGIETATNAAPMLLGIRKGFGKTGDIARAEPTMGEMQAPDISTPEGRAATLKNIGLETVRKSSIDADPMQGALEIRTAKDINNPASPQATDQFTAERQALQNHAQSIVEKTGGTPGLDEASLANSGQAIAAPFDALRDHFKTAIKSLYQEADARSGDVPNTSLDEFGKVLNTESTFAGKAENSTLWRGIKSYMKEQGLSDKDGNVQDVTPKQAEGLRQYMNSQWSPETSRLIGGLKESLDNDVFRGAGNDVYKLGSDMHMKMRQTLDNPNGISKLFETDPQTSINRTTPFEKIPDTLTRLPSDQFSHVVDVLKGMPEELQPQAQQALSEIKAHFANNIAQKGMGKNGNWNPKAVSQEIANNSAKHAQVFSPEELQSITDLKNAGDILDVNYEHPNSAQTYIAQQKKGWISRNAPKGVAAGAAGIGGALGGAPGAMIGNVAGGLLGDALNKSINETSKVNQFTKKTTKLSDLIKQEPK